MNIRKPILVIIALFMCTSAHAVFFSRATAWEDVTWEDAQEEGSCSLIQQIEGFGYARFLYSDRERLSLDFISLEWPSQSGLALLQSEVEVWSHESDPVELGELAVEESASPVRFKRPMSLRALYELEKGKSVKLYFHDWSDGHDTTVVVVSPLRLRESLQKFRHCTATLESVADKEKSLMAEMSNSAHFSTNSAELTQDAIKMLDDFSQKYLEMEHPLPIVVEAHADERGANEHNNKLSLQRASNVKEYLMQCGIPETQMKVSYFGESNPIEMSSNDDAWRVNRRAVITIPMAIEGQETLKPEPKKPVLDLQKAPEVIPLEDEAQQQTEE